jgi:hypothetical protein
MGERLIPKLDRLGAEAGIKQMTPEIYNFAMLVRADVVAQWPERPWVGLTDDDWKEIEDMPDTFDQGVAWCLAKLKRKNA